MLVVKVVVGVVVVVAVPVIVVDDETEVFERDA